MARQTRRGMQFSPYELDASHRHTRDVGLIETTAIDDLIEGALAIADRHFQDLEDGNIADEEDDEWEDAFEVISLAPSPLSSAASSPLSSPPRSRPGSPSASVSSKLRQASPDSCKSRSGSPLSDSCPTTPMPIDPADDPDLTPLVHNVHRRWRLEKAVARRRKRRRRAAPHTPFERRPNLHRSQVHREQPPETLNVDAGDLPVSSGGAWTGKRSKEKRRLFNLPELRAMKCKVIQWNGRSQTMVKNVVFCVAKQKLLDRSQKCDSKFHLCQCGDDRLEVSFSDACCQTHSRNHDSLELADKLSVTADIQEIMIKYPEFDRGHRRLKYRAKEGMDHVLEGGRLG
ncbi:hypothetical protein B0H10DRAFT_632187 [Mycena sp. CBHHK59/15]|nr:hypothetical protein B0H10DRAFT_632187 [Mycena sp. CBHHK59/15]